VPPTWITEWLPATQRLDAESRARFDLESARAGAMRVRRLLVLMVVLHLLHVLVFVVYTPSVTPGVSTERSSIWLRELQVLHGGMACVAVALGWLSARWRKAGAAPLRGLLVVVSLAYLVFGALVMAVDTQVGALPIAYLVACMGVGLIIALPAPWAALVYGVSFVVALVGVRLLQPDSVLRMSLSVNALTFALMGLGIGRLQVVAAQRQFVLAQTIAAQQGLLAAALQDEQAYGKRLALEVTARRSSEDHLQLLLTTDDLTGAASRRHLFERAKGVAGGVLMVDLDHFKTVNDRHGHDVGDAVLRGVVARMQGVLRPTDLVARLGGEEFAVLLPDAGEEHTALVAERLRVAVAAAPFDTASGPLQVTVSAGWSLLAPQESLDAVLVHADKGLYLAKNGGRNRVATAGRPIPSAAG
jgi:diguanylate cyclase (GGDEF)-like protein